jgi:hypothetical protein
MCHLAHEVAERRLSLAGPTRAATLEVEKVLLSVTGA